MYENPCAPQVAIVTCMDPRIQLSKALGRNVNESFVLRNGGGRVTDDVLRGLILCTRLMKVTEIGVIHHTDCRLQQFTNEELALRTGIDIDFKSFSDPVTSVVEDVNRLSNSDILHPNVRVWGGLYVTEDHVVRVISDTCQLR
jgi:carbonic anhydrase